MMIYRRVPRAVKRKAREYSIFTRNMDDAEERIRKLVEQKSIAIGDFVSFMYFPELDIEQCRKILEKQSLEVENENIPNKYRYYHGRAFQVTNVPYREEADDVSNFETEDLKNAFEFKAHKKNLDKVATK
jgi:hypothetical protein